MKRVKTTIKKENRAHVCFFFFCKLIARKRQRVIGAHNGLMYNIKVV